MCALPSRRVIVARRWLGPAPDDPKTGEPSARRLWTKRRKHCWQVRWWLIGSDGKPKSPSRSFKTKDEAEAFAHTKRSEYAEGATRREPQRLTLGEFIREVREHRTGAKGRRLRYFAMVETVQALEGSARHVGEGIRLSDITKPQVIGFVRAMENRGTLSVNTIGKMARTLKAALSSAVAMGYLRFNPLLGLPCEATPGPIRYVTPEELAAILAVTDERPDALW